jgi:hypothetical protein
MKFLMQTVCEGQTLSADFMPVKKAYDYHLVGKIK